MQVRDSRSDKLENSLLPAADVPIPRGVDSQSHLAALTEDLMGNICEPFTVSAAVMEPGFPDIPVGDSISGYCLAKRNGYWLVYQPDQHRFYCFWGTEVGNLGAHGISGSPLYCWSA